MTLLLLGLLLSAPVHAVEPTVEPVGEVIVAPRPAKTRLANAFRGGWVLTRNGHRVRTVSPARTVGVLYLAAELGDRQKYDQLMLLRDNRHLGARFAAVGAVVVVAGVAITALGLILVIVEAIIGAFGPYEAFAGVPISYAGAGIGGLGIVAAATGGIMAIDHHRRTTRVDLWYEPAQIAAGVEAHNLRVGVTAPL